MRRTFVLFFVIAILVSACAQKEEKVALTEGMPGYELGVEFSAKIPAVHPDSNKVLASTKYFDVTTGEVLQTISTNFNDRVGQLRTMNSAQVKEIFTTLAKNIAERNLLLKEAEERNIVVADSEVDSILQRTYLRHGGEDKFIEWLGKNGMILATVRDDIRTNLLIDAVLDTVLESKVQVTEADIQEVYERDKTATVRHILLMTQGKSDSAKQAIHSKMEGILERAKGGEDFAELAKEYSEDPGSKGRGGLYENFGRGKMVKPFEDAAFSIPIGELSDIIETQYGYHILKVIDRQKETRPLEEVSERIANELERKKRSDVYNQYMEELREKAKLQLFDL